VEHLRENGADGISDVEGKVARVAMSELGNERISMLLAADLKRSASEWSERDERHRR
jgi:hypothetical protein